MADVEPAVVESAAVPERRSDAPVRRSRPPSNATLTGSTLTASERSEYHYVERDLRNIGILSLVMVAMLLAAWFAFNALGLI
jgi:hypothetical protein